MLRRTYGFQFDPTADQIKNLALQEISDLLGDAEKTMADFGLPTPALSYIAHQTNRLILEQTTFNIQQLAEEVAREVSTLNHEQLDLYTKVMHSCASANDSKLFFIDGPGGTGKTYLENVMLKSIRSERKIALATASSGIAALLLSRTHCSFTL